VSIETRASKRGARSRVQSRPELAQHVAAHDEGQQKSPVALFPQAKVLAFVGEGVIRSSAKVALIRALRWIKEGEVNVPGCRLSHVRRNIEGWIGHTARAGGKHGSLGL